MRCQQTLSHSSDVETNMWYFEKICRKKIVSCLKWNYFFSNLMFLSISAAPNQSVRENMSLIPGNMPCLKKWTNGEHFLCSWLFPESQASHEFLLIKLVHFTAYQQTHSPRARRFCGGKQCSSRRKIHWLLQPMARKANSVWGHHALSCWCTWVLFAGRITARTGNVAGLCFAAALITALHQLTKSSGHHLVLRLQARQKCSLGEC